VDNADDIKRIPGPWLSGAIMSDDTSKRGAADRSRINLEQDYEVRDWSKTLGVTKEELVAAVKAVGNSADKVREYLKKKN
jgi:Protein of unknown function (DUF3606)